MKISTLDLNLLRKCIINKEQPVYESTLLREFFGKTKIIATDPEFFKAHFTLLNGLYRLADQIEREGDKLYILLGMIYYRKSPPPDLCRYFDEGKRDFCKKPSISSECYCLLHSETEKRIRQEGENQKVRLKTIRDFYLNEENLEKTTQQDLEDIMSGAFFLVGNTEEIKESLLVMSLPSNYSEKRLKQRYRHLVSQYHPDKIDGNSDKFIKVERAYSILIKWVRFRLI